MSIRPRKINGCLYHPYAIGSAPIRDSAAAIASLPVRYSILIGYTFGWNRLSLWPASDLLEDLGLPLVVTPHGLRGAP